MCYCHICGKEWHTLDPSVRFLWGDGNWACEDEVACFERRAMQKGLDRVWKLLDTL